jgi:hypothetical protein
VIGGFTTKKIVEGNSLIVDSHSCPCTPAQQPALHVTGNNIISKFMGIIVPFKYCTKKFRNGEVFKSLELILVSRIIDKIHFHFYILF